MANTPVLSQDLIHAVIALAQRLHGVELTPWDFAVRAPLTASAERSFVLIALRCEDLVSRVLATSLGHDLVGTAVWVLTQAEVDWLIHLAKRYAKVDDA